MRKFLYYWKPETLERELSHGAMLNHSASDQFHRIHPGDHVWHVTAKSGKLFVIGRLIVADVVSQSVAAQRLGTDNLWDASHHLIGKAGTIEPVREIRIKNLADWLRFKSPKGRDRLDLTDGAINVQQLRTMRLLMPACAAALEEKFDREKTREDSN